MASFLRILDGYGRGRTLAKAAICLVLAAPATAQTITIAALGDSLTQGYGLAQDEGFVPRLEAWLEEAGADVEIVNAGVSGDTTAGGLSRIDWTLTPEIDAMIVALGGNDVLRGIDPATSRANLDGILGRIAAEDLPVLLVGISAPGNYGEAYRAAFEAIYADLSAEYDTLLVPDFLGALARLPDRQDALAAYMQADGIHPNARGVERVVDEIGPFALELVERAR